VKREKAREEKKGQRGKRSKRIINFQIVIEVNKESEYDVLCHISR
jgi:hypothetical protein